MKGHLGSSLVFILLSCLFLLSPECIYCEIHLSVRREECWKREERSQFTANKNREISADSPFFTIYRFRFVCLFVWVGGVGKKGATGVRVTAIAWTVDSSPPDPGQNSFL